MKKTTAILIVASFLGLGSLSFAQDRSAASIKDKPTATKPEPGKPGNLSKVAASPKKPGDGVDKPKPDKPRFPPHWGKPPAIQTRDIRPLPAGFGMGSSTLLHWIEHNIKADLAKKDKSKPEPKRPPVARPPKPPRPEISAEARVALAEIELGKASLLLEMREEVDNLGDDASREDVLKTVEAFKERNADEFAAIKAAADKVHEELKANRPERRERPEPTAEVKEKIEAVHVAHKEIHEARKGLRADLKEATDEQKKGLIKDFRDSQKDKHEELKAAHKELRETIRANKEEGDRRADAK